MTPAIPTAARTSASAAKSPSSTVLNRRGASEAPMRSSIVRTSDTGWSRSRPWTTPRTVVATEAGSAAARTTRNIGRTVQPSKSGCAYGT